MIVTPVTVRRKREKGVLVYPVYSRRSGGLSVGINLYPREKSCSFNCPYCEVFPFTTNTVFSLEQMKEELLTCLSSAKEQNIPVKDICFSGNGEPSLSEDFPLALELAENIRRETAASAQPVLISNGCGLLQPEIFSLLKKAACENLIIWLKLDAGTKEWYRQMNRSEIPYEELTAKIREFTACAPVTIQTMLCSVNGKAPPPQEEQAWEQLVTELAKNGNIRKVQIYGKARPAPEDPKASPLPAGYLEKRSTSLRNAFVQIDAEVPVEVYL